MKDECLTPSQHKAYNTLAAYLDRHEFFYSPAVLAGHSGTGKTRLAKTIAHTYSGYHANIAADHLDGLVRYHSFAKVTPEEVARLVVQLCRDQREGPLIADGLESILTAIAFNNHGQPNIIGNFLTTLKRTRDLPAPAIVIVQIGPLIPIRLFHETAWWNDPQFAYLELGAEDKKVIAENLQVMPATAEKASSAIEIVLSQALSAR